MSICYYDSLNFGDELGPVVAKRLLENHFGCSAASLPVLNLFSGDRVKEEDTTCLFVLGSVFHMVKEGDHVWGIGVNPSHFRAGTLPKSLTLHSVRGPLTSNFIKKEGFNSTKNDSLPLGDPGVLLPSLFGLAKSHGRVCFVVHKNDLGHTFVRKPPPNVHIITCAQHWETAVTEIQSCGFVASSSLHGIVVADALSIPRLWFQFNDTSTIRTEGNFKYQDYLQSIGHMNARPIRNVTFIEDTTKYSNVLTQSELQAIINQTSASFPYHLFHT